jgi:hypothetical protein
MHPYARLAEAVRKISDLLTIVDVPVLREKSLLGVEAQTLSRRLSEARIRLDQTRSHATRFGWIPIFGKKARMQVKEAMVEVQSVSDAKDFLLLRGGRVDDDLLKSRTAKRWLTYAESVAAKGLPTSVESMEAVDQLLARTDFLAGTDGREASKSGKMAPKVFALARQAAEIAKGWSGGAVVYTNRSVETTGTGTGRRTQFALDFDGVGQIDDGPRIYLPISSTREREMVLKGVRVDRDASRKGSKMWIPLADKEKVDQFLPLAFRKEGTHFAFPPIRHNAIGQNLWSVFDRDSWNHIRTTAYDRAGHRCQICGKQGGDLWSKLASGEERGRGGLVDCHEVWEWEPPDHPGNPGVQRLKRLLVVCKDCHLLFHESFALWRAKENGIEEAASDYIRGKRMMINRCDGVALDAQLADDKIAWDKAKNVDKWVLDLSHLAAQDFMNDVTLILQNGNKAGVTPELVGGTPFMTEDGTCYAVTDADELAHGGRPHVVSHHDKNV